MPRDPLQTKADWVRWETLQLHLRSPETRVASSLSCVEILTALFYGDIVRHRPEDPGWSDRDRFLVSKGHGSISFYPILVDRGFVDASQLERISRPEGIFKVIPDHLIPGYESINGSLGHGLGVGCGLALALRARKSTAKVFVLTGDGELDEGSMWEAIAFAGHHALDNLVLVVDANGGSMLDFTRNVLDLSPLEEKLSAFRWEARGVDGHDLNALGEVFADVHRRRHSRGRPLGVVAHTVKGKGIPSLERDPMSHLRVLKPEEVDAAFPRGET